MHAVPRRFPAGALTLSGEAALYAARPEAWPGFLAYLRSERAHLLGDMTDEQLADAHKGSAQLFADLLAKVAPEVLVLRNVQVRDVVLTAETGEDAPGVLTLGLTDDGGGMAALSWIVTRACAEALASACRDQLGEPDTEALADCAGTVRMQDAAAGNMTVMTRDCEHGEP